MASRLYLLLYLIGYVAWREARQSTGLLHASLRADAARLRKLFALGLPAALQLVFEVGVFVVVTTLVGTLDAISLAAHHIALSAASVTFMIPLGISSAAAVRVGQVACTGALRGLGDTRTP